MDNEKKGNVEVKLVNGKEQEKKTMFLVTVETDFTIKNKKVISNKDLSNKNILDVEQRDVFHNDIEDLGIEVRKFNQRQEFYILENPNQADGSMKFMYLSSKDPREKQQNQ